MKNLPTVVTSRDGSVAMEVIAFDGLDQIENRDAFGYYFAVRLEPDGLESRLATVFSGTVMAVRPSGFGLPNVGDRETTFIQFSLAAIGDCLDEWGLPDFTPSGVSAFKIECLSPHFQSWSDRPPADDAALEAYLRGQAVGAWRFDKPTFEVGMPDVLRMRRDISRFYKIIRLYEGELWKSAKREPSHIVLEPTPELLRSAAKATEHDVEKAVAPVAGPIGGEEVAIEPAAYVYVDETRLADLRRIESTEFDLIKLIALCEEINVCYRSQCYHAVAALTRTMIYHVPPVFGCRTFSEVANNYSGSRSFKDCMRRLDEAARRIADGHLHTRVRSSETLPTRTQVNFSNEVDVLLGEIIRLLKPPSGSSKK